MGGALRLNDLGKIMAAELRSPRLAVLIDADNASAKIADGLFEQFPCDVLFAMHNAPGMPVGQFGAVAG